MTITRIWQGITTLAVAMALLLSGTSKAAPPKPTPLEKKIASTPARSITRHAAQRYRHDREVLALRRTLQMVKHLAQQKKTAKIQQITRQLTDRYLSAGKPTPSPEQLRMLAQIYRAAGDSTRAQGLSETWLKAFQTDEKYRASMTPSSLLDLAKESKIIGQEAVVANVAQAGEQWLAARMGNDQSPGFPELCDVLELGILANSQNLQQAARQAMAGKDNTILRKELAPFELVRYSKVLAKTKDKQAQQQLANFIVNDYLPTPGLAEALNAYDWHSLAEVIQKVNDNSCKNRMWELIKARLDHNRLGIKSLERHYLESFYQTIIAIGGNKEKKSVLASQWLCLVGVWPTLHKDLQDLITQAVFGNNKAFAKIDRQFRTKQKDNGLTPAEGVVLLALLSRLNQTKATREWTELMWNRLSCTDNPSPNEFVFTIHVFSLTSRTWQDKEMQALLERLMGYQNISSQLTDTTYRRLSRLFSRKKTWQEMLEKQLIRKDGGMNLPVLKTLAWHERENKRIRSFLLRLSRQMKTAEPKGDVRAEWCLGMAYAVSLVNDNNPCRSQGNGTIMTALDACHSDTMRLQCIEELVAACIAAKRYEEPIQIIESLKEQFDKKQQKQLTAMTTDLRQRAAVWKTVIARHKEYQKIRDKADRWETIFRRRFDVVLGQEG